MKHTILFISAIVFCCSNIAFGQLPISQDCETLYTIKVDEKAEPNISSIELIRRFNEYDLKKSLTKRNRYISLVLWINCKGEVEKIDAYQCESFPDCGSFLKDKKLKTHLYNCVSQNINWKPGRFEGSEVNSHIKIKTTISNGRLEDIKWE